MNITFDTNAIGQAEVRGLIALLSSLIADTYPPTTQPAPLSHPIPTTEEQAIAGVPIETAQAAAAPQPQPQPPAPESAQTTTRRRRTKAEMAADALLEKTGHAPVPTPAVASGAEPQATVESAKTTVASPSVNSVSAPKPISAEDLRSLLNAFISKHSMEEAIEKLRSFGCNRVTEALALEPAKLNELAAVLNG